MKIVFSGIGTYGDVLPMLAIAKNLMRLGFDCLFLTSDIFADAVAQSGVEFVGVGSVEEYDRGYCDSGFGRSKKGTLQAFTHTIVPAIPRQFGIVDTLYRKGESLVIVTLGYSNGAYLAAEKNSLPHVRILLSPMYVNHLAARKIFNFDRWLCPYLKATNRARENIGLPTIRHSSDPLWTSKLTLGLYPDWFVGSSACFHPKVLAMGFPVVIQSFSPLSDELESFLERHNKPLVFMPGTLVSDFPGFFDSATVLTQRLGCPAIFISTNTDKPRLDERLEILHHPYAQFDQLLPRCLLLVHSGGIGSTQAAMRAGIAQVVTPRVNDQFYNAHRARSFGSALVLDSARFEDMETAKEIRNHMYHPLLKQRRGQIQKRIDYDGARLAATAIQRLSEHVA